MTLTVRIEPFTEGLLECFLSIRPDFFLMLRNRQVLIPALLFLFVQERFRAFVDRMAEKIFSVYFERLDPVVQDQRFRQQENNPVAVRRQDHFVQVDPKAGCIPVSDGGCSDCTENDHICLRFQDPFFFDGCYFQSLA